MDCAPDAIKRLVERFDHQIEQVRSPDYNEAQLRIDFINPMFRALGWDVDNTQGFAEQYREVVYEDRLKVGGATKAPDYSFRIGGMRKFFLEAKKPLVNIKENWEPAYQLRRYGWSAKLALSLLTDFEELAVYDCRIQPKQFDKASTARREYITYREYESRWDFISGTFSKDAILRGDFDRYCGATRGKGAQEFDQAFLQEIEEWRLKLATVLATRNESLDERSLNFAVQRIIDRIIFLRICEDRGLERVGRLQALLNAEEVYPRLTHLFRDADDRYNSGLFHFKPESGREELPDELTPGLQVDDAAIKGIIRRLYYPESPYEFSVVSADILGSVYERFLGKVITLTAGHRARIEEKPEVRKAGGVYYTPTYIVDYIVQQTVGVLLEGKTPKEAAKLTVLDPACGSGSFLLGAYQLLLDWHLKWHIAAGAEKGCKGRKAVLRPGQKGGWHLTINERKRILLDNIHGVDIDYQAVEVTKLSLLLKVLEGETAESLGGLWALAHERALPDLGRNIFCGNSLIGTDIMATAGWADLDQAAQDKINAFDFERGFERARKAGGFSAVIGNPPYVRMESFTPIKSYLSQWYDCHEERADLYAYFIERGLRLVAKTGRIGQIVSNKFIRAKYGRPLRGVLSERSHLLDIIDLGGADVFHSATVRTLILILQRKTTEQTKPAEYVPVPPPAVVESLEAGVTTLAEYADGAGTVLAADAIGPDEWRLSSREHSSLVKKLRRNGMALHEMLGHRAMFGVKTGCNEAFIVEGAAAKALDPKSIVLKPILFGKDVRRYLVNFADRYVIYLHPGRVLEELPLVKAHLCQFRNRLNKRAGGQKWWQLQQPAMNLAEIARDAKIVYPIIANECRFALDTDGTLVNDKVFVLPTSDLFVVGILNSRVANFYFSEVCAALEGKNDRYLEFRAQYVDVFPIPLT